MSEDFNYIHALQQDSSQPATKPQEDTTPAAAPAEPTTATGTSTGTEADAATAAEDVTETGNAPTPERPHVTATNGIAAFLAAKAPRAVAPLMRMRGLVIAAAVLAVWGAGTGFHLPGKAPDLGDPEVVAQGTARNAIGEALTAQVRNDQQAARNYLAKHGSLDGLKLSGQGVRSAAAGTIMVASRLTGGVCQAYYFNGQVDGQVFISMKDHTDAQGNPVPYLCDDAVMAAQQSELDAQAEAVEAAVQSGHQEAFANASANLVTYAMQTWSGGEPTADGVPTDLGYGVSVVSTHGSYVIARHGEGHACATAVLAVDGTVAEPSPCK